MLRSHRVDATSTLQDLAARQERYYYSNNAYTSALSDLGSNANAAGANYKMGIASASSTNYTMTATALDNQTQDTQCTSLSLNRAGQQLSEGTTSNDPQCWGH
ncbi:MAG: type IV pilin protein [Rhodanobacter sp.]